MQKKGLEYSNGGLIRRIPGKEGTACRRDIRNDLSREKEEYGTMSASEVREKYGDLLKQGKLKEIQERIETQDTEEPAPANQDTDVCETFRRIAESFSRVSLNSILQQPDMPEEARKLIKALMNREKIPDWHTIISAHKET